MKKIVDERLDNMKKKEQNRVFHGENFEYQIGRLESFFLG